jgi:hypothetical protein
MRRWTAQCAAQVIDAIMCEACGASWAHQRDSGSGKGCSGGASSVVSCLQVSRVQGHEKLGLNRVSELDPASLLAI